MAKQSKSITFRNATIDHNDMTITEYQKECTNVFSVEKLLREWSNIDGLSISIKYDEDTVQDGE